MDEVSVAVERPYFFVTNEDLAKHIKAVGEAIIKDSENIRLDTRDLQSIKIDIDISPSTNFTTIIYKLNRRADPRVVTDE